MRLSLIICTYCRADSVRQLLGCLRQQTRPPDEILLVDASPDTATAAVVAACQGEPRLPGLRYVQAPPEQRGLTRQRNYGIGLVLGSVGDRNSQGQTEDRGQRADDGSGPAAVGDPPVAALTATGAGCSGHSRAPEPRAPGVEPRLAGTLALQSGPGSPGPGGIPRLAGTLALQDTGSDIIAFLDDDTLPAPTYFAELLAAFERHPDAVGIAGYIVDEASAWHRAAENSAQWGGHAVGRSAPETAPAENQPRHYVPGSVVSATPDHRTGTSRAPNDSERGGCWMESGNGESGKRKWGERGAVFRWGDWERQEDRRWQVRNWLGLGSALPPGHMPPHGHGRSTSFYPPDGNDYAVEHFMGGAAAWRGTLFGTCQFSTYFAGYGLYEDMDFCLRAGRHGALYLCTRAQLEHHHAPGGRPAPFRYGVMVVRNGWYVWRQRWPCPPLGARARWWAITLLLTAIRFANVLTGPERAPAFAEASGRLWGALRVLLGKAEIGKAESGNGNHRAPNEVSGVAVGSKAEIGKAESGNWKA